LIENGMAVLIQDYVDLVKGYGDFAIELEVSFSDQPEISGRIDAVNTGRVLRVHELKYGRTIVDVFENEPLIIYAGSMFRNYDMTGVELIQLSVFQPRSHHTKGIHRKWTLNYDELQGYCADILVKANRCLDPKSPAIPGPWCLHCEVGAKCEALTHTNYKFIDRVLSNNQRSMSPEELSKELKYLRYVDKIFTSRKKAVEAEALARANDTFIPDFQIEHGQGKRKFTTDPLTIEILTGHKINLEKPTTPAALEKMGVSKKIVNAFSTQPRLPGKLVEYVKEHNDVDI